MAITQTPNFFDSIWEIWVKLVEFIDRRKFLSVKDWLNVLNILEDSNRDLDISYKSQSEILEILRSQKPFLERLWNRGDYRMCFPIAMSRDLYEICLQVLNE